MQSIVQSIVGQIYEHISGHVQPLQVMHSVPVHGSMVTTGSFIPPFKFF
jgi:hypothetical protein